MVDAINAGLRKFPAWLIYVGGAAWMVWLFYLGLTGGLGAEPINALEREYGIVSLWLLLASLFVTPLRTYFNLNFLKFRRAIGVTAFFFVLAHFLVFIVLDVQSLNRVVEEIVKRPYVTIGFISFVALIPLALTSNNWSVRKLGPKWRSLHKLAYPAVILGAVHYIWLSRGFQIEPLIYLVLACGLVALRFVPRKRKMRRAVAA